MIIRSAVFLVLRDPENSSKLPLMLQPILFSPVLKELALALNRLGVERFFAVCEPDLLRQTQLCLPQGAQVCSAGDPDLEEILRRFAQDGERKVLTVTAPVWLSSRALDELTEDEFINPAGDALGVYRVESALLAQGGTEALNWGEFYSPANDPEPQLLPLDGPEDLLQIRRFALADNLYRLMENGVDILDPSSVYVEAGVTVGRGTRLLPGTVLQGAVEVGCGCVIGPNTLLRDCAVGDHCTVSASQVEEVRLESGRQVGPFAYLRPERT